MQVINNRVKRYTDTVSGEELYVTVERSLYSSNSNVTYYKDRGMTIHHRVDGPAIIYAEGGSMWMANNKRHRLDGPAAVWTNGDTAWYIDGVLIMELDKHNKLVSRMGDERI